MAKRPTRPTIRARAAATRRALAAKADRDARLAAREAALTAALIDYYAAHSTATAVKADAQARAEAILSEAHRRAAAIRSTAEEQSAAAETAERKAMVAMAALGERPAAIAELCRLRVGEVRAILAAGRRASSDGCQRGPDGDGSGASVEPNALGSVDTPVDEGDPWTAIDRRSAA